MFSPLRNVLMFCPPKKKRHNTHNSHTSSSLFLYWFPSILNSQLSTLDFTFSYYYTVCNNSQKACNSSSVLRVQSCLAGGARTPENPHKCVLPKVLSKFLVSTDTISQVGALAT